MIVVYTIITVLSAVLFTADMVLRYMEKIENFSLENKLIRFKGNTIPYELFFPDTPVMVLLTAFVFGVCGLYLTHDGFGWYLSLPLGAVYSLLFCFFCQYFVRGIIVRQKGLNPPKGEAASGIEGFAAEDIPGDSYGLVEFEYMGMTFQKNAVSEYGTFIPKYERVFILYETNDMYAVESITEVYEIFSEREDN